MQRFLFERRKDDREFPLLDVKLDQWRLWAMLIFISAAMLIWMALGAVLDFHGFLSQLILINFLPVAIIVAGLIYLSQGQLTKLFGKPRLGDFGFAVIMLILQGAYAILISILLGNVGISLGQNAAATEIENAASKTTEYGQNLITDLFDLLGEELLSIIIFLTVAALLIQYYHMSRRAGLTVAMLASMFLFGFLHFEAYNWNLIQMFIVIAGERFFLNGVFIRSKTIWPSYITHMLFDAVAFAVALAQH